MRAENLKKNFPKSIEKFKELLAYAKGKKIAVAGHMRPDGDCVSSQFALAHFLRRAGASEVVCVNKDPVPALYKEFVGEEIFVSAQEFNDASYEIITVDCADYARISADFHLRFPQVFACVDHHISNPLYAKINILEAEASATAELLAGLAFDCGISLSKELASSLYMGIMMDTRQLTTSSASLRTFEIVAGLVACGVDTAEAARLLYQRENFGRLKLLSEYLHSLTMHYDNKVCIGVLPLGIYDRTGSSKEETDGLVDYARNIDSVEIAVLIEMLPDGLKGSMRSKYPKVKVNEIAAEFGGGGHTAAAGFNLKMSFDDFFPKFLEALGRHLQK